MEHIKKAIELSQNSLTTGRQRRDSIDPPPLAPQLEPAAFPPPVSQFRVRQIELNKARLESQRIIAFNNADPRSKAFDILRTQVLQSMHAKMWQLLGVTSPTSNCGKTVTAVNLALSIARQPETAVLLIDMDLQKPQVANYLGIKCEHGLLGVLEGRTRLANAIVQARVGNQRLMVLPGESSTPSSSEWMSSRAMGELLRAIRHDFRSWIVVLDMPPILPSDEVISILPRIDCVLFVAAVGATTAPEITECNKHLQSAPVVRIVLNKASELGSTYY